MTPVDKYGKPPSGHAGQGQAVGDDPYYGQLHTYIGLGTGSRPAALPFDQYVTPQFKKGHQYVSPEDNKTYSVKQRYGLGADWAILAGKTPGEIIDLQNRMVQIGVLAPGKFVPGDALSDPSTMTAFKKVLEAANARGERFGDYLDHQKAIADAVGFDPFASKTKQKIAPPLDIQLSSPTDIKAKLADTATTELGSASYAGDPNAFVKDYQARERLDQTQKYDLSTGGAQPGQVEDPNAPGQTVTSPSLDIGNILREQHPGLAQAAALGPNAQKLIDLLQQNVGAGAGMQIAG